MIYYKNVRKIIAFAVIIVFVFQFPGDGFLFSQDDNLVKQFNKARDAYINNQYDRAVTRLERIIGIIDEEGLDRKDILGKCYLLLGAIYEKQGKQELAGQHYRRAIKEYGIKTVEGVAFEGLKLYEKVVGDEIKARKQMEEKVLEKAGVKKKKKKFPVLLVVGAVVVVAVLVILLFKKKKSDNGDSQTPQNPEFITNVDNITVPEGGTAEFQVRLSTQPTSDVSVSVVRVEGDTDISVQAGSNLTFTTSNWNQYQAVTVAANEDVDTTNDTATVQISAGAITDKNITVTEQDNDSLNFETDIETITVPEEGTAAFGVKLSNEPESNVEATVKRESGDEDIYVNSGNNLTFTITNWNTYQQVILSAKEDSDTTNGTATFLISADGVTNKNITATEADRDTPPTVDVRITKPENGEEVTGTIDIEAKATSPNGIDRVVFLVDGDIKGTAYTGPTYSVPWNSSKESDGPHTIKAVAYDKLGNKEDAEIEVTTDNY